MLTSKIFIIAVILIAAVFWILESLKVFLKVFKKVNQNAKFRYDFDLAARFVSDYKLPVSVINSKSIFRNQLVMLEPEYGAMTKWDELWQLIDEKYEGSQKAFLDDYYQIRDKIIMSTLDNPAYKEFNEMDMSKYAFKRPEGVSKNNVYNGANLRKRFFSIDMSKANFQALRFVNPDIVLGAKTYVEFINKFTPLEYVSTSKYSRQVIFGKLNVERQMTVERYITNEIRLLIQDLPELEVFRKSGACLVSQSNDELIYETTEVDNGVVDMKKVSEVIIKNVHEQLGIDVHTEEYTLRGWQLCAKSNSHVSQTFFEKIRLDKQEEFRHLVCVPLSFHNIIYKLLYKQPLTEMDMYFVYEKKMLCKFTDIFELKEIF